MSQGFVYVLVSANSNYIKIGGTERPISERIRGINSTIAYAEHGPWELSDFLHVTDWRLVEGGLHQHFKDQRILDISGTRELFDVPPHQAREQLRLTDNILRVDREKTDSIFSNQEIKLFLYRIFQISGLYGSLDTQGAWTLSILPKTNGGRWFTLNIGSHEVAFTPRQSEGGKFLHYIVLDKLILEYPETIMWLGRRDGAVLAAEYASAERAVLINFWEDFARAERFFSLPGVRRALIAYWFEALANLRQRNVKSAYARYHSYDAVSQLLEYKRAADKLILPNN